MAAEFGHLLREVAGGAPIDATSAWAAFRAFALRPIHPGRVAANINEDVLMFDVYSGSEFPSLLRLVRRVSLADEHLDHVDTAVFECRLLYEPAADVASLNDGAMTASFDPARATEDVERFLDEVEQSRAYRVLVGQRRPARVELSP